MSDLVFRLNDEIKKINRRIAKKKSVIESATAELSAMEIAKISLCSVVKGVLDPVDIEHRLGEKKRPKHSSRSLNGMTVIEACKMILDETGRSMSADVLADKLVNQLGWKTEAKYFGSSVNTRLSNVGTSCGIYHRKSTNGTRIFWTEKNK